MRQRKSKIKQHLGVVQIDRMRSNVQISGHDHVFVLQSLDKGFETLIPELDETKKRRTRK
jgi:2-keto-3-deoxy-L-rhamnonate aldolase RhmA